MASGKRRDEEKREENEELRGIMREGEPEGR
jgi:hypothetical protein